MTKRIIDVVIDDPVYARLRELIDKEIAIHIKNERDRIIDFIKAEIASKAKYHNPWGIGERNMGLKIIQLLTEEGVK